MREILFKAKRIDNGEWVEGLPSYNDYNDNEEIAEIETRHMESVWFLRVNPSTICQYTGLTDKNGKKIWENDIVELYDRNNDYTWRAIVKFGNPNHEYTWGWQLQPIGECEENYHILLWIDMEETGAFCEVIGNIFDNQDLSESEV